MSHQIVSRRVRAWWTPRAAALGALLCMGAALALPAAAQTVRFEAESYQNFGSGSGLSKTGGSSGIGQETGDAAGVDGEHVSGSYVTYFRNTGNNGLQEYLEYKVTVPDDGMYTLTVRGAYPANAPATGFRFWDLTYGAVLEGGFNVSTSGGFWAENMAQLPFVTDATDVASAPILIPLKAGDHVIRIYAMNRGINPDWWELTRVGDITGYGLVTGKVTDGAKGIGPAQVFANVLLTGGPGTPLSFGFRAISDANGNYKLIAPLGSTPLAAAAPGYDVDGSNAPMATVNVDPITPVSQDLMVVWNGQTESEWFTNARTSPVPNGFGYGAYDRAGSWGQVVGQFQMPGFFLDYEVSVPSDGLYSLTLQHSSDRANAPDRLLDIQTSTGYWTEESLPKTSGNEPFTFPVPVPLKAGKNTVTVIQPTLQTHNTDFLTVTDTGQPFGSAVGTVAGPPDSSIATLADANGKIVGKATTVGGDYRIAAQPGDYTLTVSHSGYASFTKAVTITAGQETITNGSLAKSDTITIVPQDLKNIYNGANEVPRIYYPYTGSASGATIGNLGTDSWVEFPFTVTNIGLYSVALNYSAANPAADIPANRTLVVDIRPAAGGQHYATPDLVLTPTGDNHLFVDSAAVGQAPLTPGNYILRVHNVTGLHAAAPAAPQTSTTSTNVGQITLSRTGDLPAMGTITGTVSSSDLGLTVADAMVLANAPGNEVTAPSRFSYHGFWTTTGADGKYTLTVPVGIYSVQAARADTYQPATVTPVAVTTSGATANASLSSKWSSGTIRLEDEYYFNKVAEAPGSGSGTGVQLIPDPGSSNGYRLGAVGDEDWIELHVDVPVAGDYTLTPYYFNATSTVARFTANDGAAFNATLTSSGSNTTQNHITLDQTLPLKAGQNTIRIFKFTGGTADLDALELSRVAPPMTPAMKALRIAGGLDEASVEDLATLNVVVTGDSATVIDLQDAVELARQG